MGCWEGKVLKDEGKFFLYQKSEVSLKSEDKILSWKVYVYHFFFFFLFSFYIMGESGSMK